MESQAHAATVKDEYPAPAVPPELASRETMRKRVKEVLNSARARAKFLCVKRDKSHSLRCDICNESSTPFVPSLRCDLCDSIVHKRCFSTWILRGPLSDSWLCDRCLLCVLRPLDPIQTECMICGERRGAMQLTFEQDWIHPACAGSDVRELHNSEEWYSAGVKEEQQVETLLSEREDRPTDWQEPRHSNNPWTAVEDQSTQTVEAWYEVPERPSSTLRVLYSEMRAATGIQSPGTIGELVARFQQFLERYARSRPSSDAYDLTLIPEVGELVSDNNELPRDSVRAVVLANSHVVIV